MSAATPSSQPSPAPASPTNVSQDPPQNMSTPERVILEYLRARGHKSAEKAFLEEIEGRSLDDQKQVESIGKDELIRALAVFAQKPSRPGENVLKDSTTVLQELQAVGSPANIQALIASIGTVGAEEILAVDPTDKEEGFRELEAWVDGSLDMYRVRLYFRTNLLSLILEHSRSSGQCSSPYFAISI